MNVVVIIILGVLSIIAMVGLDAFILRDLEKPVIRIQFTSISLINNSD